MIVSLPLAMALVPSLLLMWYFHARDAFPEPPRVLWATFGFGVLSIVPTLIFALPTLFLLQAISGPIPQGFVSAFLSAAIPEEFCKFMVLYLYCIRHPEFNEPMDGVVYGVAASLGFASLENVLYVSQYGVGNAVLRAFTAVPMHAFCGALMGSFVGRGVFEPSRRGPLFFQGWLAAMAMHGLYDFPLLTSEAMAAQAEEQGSELGAGILVLFGASLFILVFLGVWAGAAVGRLRRGQEQAMARRRPSPAILPRMDGLDQAWLAPPPPAFDPHPPKPPSPAGSNALAAWLLIVGGGILASGGGLLTLLMVVGIAAGGSPQSPTLDQMIGATCCVGVLPLVLGGVLFASGVRMLNRP